MEAVQKQPAQAPTYDDNQIVRPDGAADDFGREPLLACEIQDRTFPWATWQDALYTVTSVMPPGRSHEKSLSSINDHHKLELSIITSSATEKAKLSTVTEKVVRKMSRSTAKYWPRPIIQLDNAQPLNNQKNVP